MWSRFSRAVRTTGTAVLAALWLSACSDPPTDTTDGLAAPDTGQVQQPATSMPTVETPASPVADASQTPPSTEPPPGNGPMPEDPHQAPAMDAAGMEPAGAAGMPANVPAPGGGPVDGDPNAPMVEVPGVPCGAPNLSFINVPAENMVQIGGRDVFVAYPCANEGAAVTFFLFIHGTLGEGQKIPFTMTNFPVHTKVDSDNFIVVTPQAIGTQWGNGDGGQDLPHLYEVIDWVYDTFGEKFDIRSMWASGGSWGAFYLRTFACDPMLENRLNGVRMVVGGGCPPCSDRLACIVAQQELELGNGSTLSDAEKEERVMRADVETYATAHGCDARVGPTNVGPVRAWTWPNCDAGFAHSYYLGPGEHADRWDDPAAVDHMVLELKSID